MSLVECEDIGKNSANANLSCMDFSHGSRSLRRCTVSSLFGIRITGLPLGISCSALASSAPNLPASTMNSTMSTSVSTDTTVLFSDLLSAAECFVW